MIILDLTLGQNPRSFIQHIEFVKLNSSYETGLTISRLFLTRFSKNSLSKTLNLYRRINELALTSSNQRINNYELNSSELNAKGMYETGLKLKYCAGSVMPRCVLTVLSNGFKKPVFSGVFGRFSVFYPNRLTLHANAYTVHANTLWALYLLLLFVFLYLRLSLEI